MARNSARTVDWLFGWANEHYGLDLPRLSSLPPQSPLAAFWTMALVTPPTDESDLPLTVQVTGNWQLADGLTLDELSVTLSAQRASPTGEVSCPRQSPSAQPARSTAAKSY